MKNSLFKFGLVAVVAAGFLVPNSYAGKGGGKKALGYQGKVDAVTADGAVTVSNRKLGDKTFKTDANTKVLKTDGTAGALADVKTGSRVRVSTGTDTSVAQQIQLVERKKKDAPAPAPAASPAASPTA